MRNDINEVNKERLARYRQERDLAYSERNKMLVALCKMALKLGCKAGIGLQEGANWDDEWLHIVFIDLPTGQVSWHIHNSERDNFNFLSEYYDKWDGHTTEEKWNRVINAFDVDMAPLNISSPPGWDLYDAYVKDGGDLEYTYWYEKRKLEQQPIGQSSSIEMSAYNLIQKVDKLSGLKGVQEAFSIIDQITDSMVKQQVQEYVYGKAVDMQYKSNFEHSPNPRALNLVVRFLINNKADISQEVILDWACRFIKKVSEIGLKPELFEFVVNEYPAKLDQNLSDQLVGD